MRETDHTDLALVLKGKAPIIILETYDEPEALALLGRLRKGLFGSAWRWTHTQGLEPLGFGLELKNPEEYTEPSAMLKYLKAQHGAQLFVLCDLHPFIDEPKVVRYLKDIALDALSKKQKLVLLSHQLKVPAELKRLSVKAQIRLPDAEEIMSIVREQAREWQEDNHGQKIRTDSETLDRLVANLIGLPHQDVRRLAHGAIVDDGAITDADLPELTRAKFALMDMEGVLHFEYSTEHLQDVAGFTQLKSWLARRRAAFIEAKSRSGGADIPKGVLLFGVQGGGKSLAAKAIAGVWGVPLLRLDMASLYNKYIGETERNLREALKLADLMEPCVLWVDELEKGLAEDSDNAVGKRLLGTLLTWMAERKSRVFLVATSNDVSQLPPELMRKGRFDEIFFVDLPATTVREDIFRIHMTKRRLSIEDIDLSELAAMSEGFTGAEIEQVIVSALYEASAEEKVLAQRHLEHCLRNTQPLSVLRAEHMASLRHWASERAINA